MAIALTDTVRATIESALAVRGEPFARFTDDAYAVRLGEREALYLLVFSGADGAARARTASERVDRFRKQLPVDVATVVVDLSEAGRDGEGILLVLGPRGDCCVPLTARSADEQARTLTVVRAHAALARVDAEDLWLNTTLGDERPTPFLIRTDRITDAA